MALLPRASLRAAALCLLGVSRLQETLSQQVVECDPSTNADFDYEVVPEPGIEIRWSIDTTAETISVQLASTAAAWAAVGFSPDGMMVGSDAGIGLPDDTAVVEYQLTAQNLSGVVPFDEQEIFGGTVAQTPTGTTVSFTRPLTPTTAGKQLVSATPGDETWLIWAVGDDNELAYHDVFRGGLLLDLFCGDTGVAVATPSPSTATGNTTAPTAVAAPTPAPAAIGGGSPTNDGPTAAPSMSIDPTPAPGDAGDASPGTAVTFSPTSPGTTDALDQTNGAFRVGGIFGWSAVTAGAAALIGTAAIVSW